MPTQYSRFRWGCDFGGAPTAVGRAGAWLVTLRGVRARADTNDLGAASLPTPSGRGAGASGAVLAVMVSVSVSVSVVMSVVVASRN